MKRTRKISIPKTLHEVSLGQYQEYVKVQDTDPQKREKLVSIFLNLDRSWLKVMKLKQVNQIADHLENLLNTETPLIKIFKVNKTSFGFIPKLSDMSFGECMDLDNFLKDWQTVHKAMAVLYRPIKIKIRGRYAVQPYIESMENEHHAELMRFMPLDVALSALGFLHHLRKDLLKAAPDNIITSTTTELKQRNKGAIKKDIEEVLEKLKTDQL